VAGVGVNPQLRVRQPVGEQVRIARRHHAVVVAVGDEYGLRDASEPVELARFGDAPCVDRVQLRRNVDIVGEAMHALATLRARAREDEAADEPRPDQGELLGDEPAE
jgi:hypothetical protein